MGMGQNPFFLSLCSLCLLFCFGCVPSSSFIVEEIKLWLILWSLLVYTHFRNDSTGTGLNVLCSSVDRNKPKSLLPFRPFLRYENTKSSKTMRRKGHSASGVSLPLHVFHLSIEGPSVISQEQWKQNHHRRRRFYCARFFVVSITFKTRRH